MATGTRIGEARESSATRDLNGADIRRLLTVGTSWLEHNAAAVNALNVFPVPDGDTGTNMTLTMRSAAEAAEKTKSSDAGQVMRAAAQGAVMGARGNSGVILSQIIAGLAKGMEGASVCHGRMLAEALAEGATTAYRAVTRPVEGTILTVARAAGDGALAAVHGRDEASVSCLQVLERAHAAAQRAVERTPEQLAQLKQAGVVDAGGEGYRLILDGMVYVLRDGLLPEAEAEAGPEPAALLGRQETAVALPVIDASAIPVEEWGYCTQFVIRGDSLSVDKLRDELQSIAESTLVVGDDQLVRVHGHTEDPGQLLSYAVQFGRLDRISIEDMDAQHDSWLKNQVEGFPVLATAANGESRDSASDELPSELATVAVAPGAGLGDVFRSLGASEIVPGGQSMNPSARDILEAAKRTRARTVIVLPNNPNVVTTAQHAAGVSGGDGPQLLVVPTRTVPQGIAAQLAFTAGGDADAALTSMTAAAGAVRTVEITRATRSVTIEGITVREGDALGLLDDKLVAAATSVVEAAKQALGCAEADRAELITVYRGAGVPEPDGERFLEAVKELYPGAELELVAGDQPHYDYIISVE